MDEPMPYTCTKATTEVFARYLRLMESVGEDPMEGHERLSLKNLRWICEEGIAKSGQLPIDKLSRWLGFVQGCLAMRQIIDVDEERDFTRPLFHRAYRDEGSDVPDVHERRAGE
jgi:hypothetical protein